jgi:hypothetical protein
MRDCGSRLDTSTESAVILASRSSTGLSAMMVLLPWRENSILVNLARSPPTAPGRIGRPSDGAERSQPVHVPVGEVDGV